MLVYFFPTLTLEIVLLMKVLIAVVLSPVPLFAVAVMMNNKFPTACGLIALYTFILLMV